MTSANPTTAEAILDAAQTLTQTVGYNGLSIRDLAVAAGIRSASIYHHFPSKESLAAAVARRYTDRLLERLAAIEASGVDPSGALAAYAGAFRTTLENDGRMCLCGMLAAETDAVPPDVRAEVRRFVELNVQWIARMLRRQASAPAAEAQAKALFAALEGAMLIARGTGDAGSFDLMLQQFERVGLMRCG